MKNSIRIVIIFLLALCSTAQAQDTLSSNAKLPSQPYKTAISLQNSAGSSAVRATAKHFFSQNSGLELQVSHINAAQAYYASLYYFWQPNLFNSERLRPYIGIGPSAYFELYRSNGEVQGYQRQYGVKGVVGLEYNFENIPLALTAEYRINVLTIGDRQKDYSFQPAGGFYLGGKYLVKR